DVEIVERDDPIEAFAAREERRALADVRLGHVAAHVEELVDRFTRPVGVAELLLGQQQHAAALPSAFAQEFVALAIRREAQNRERHPRTTRSGPAASRPCPRVWRSGAAAASPATGCPPPRPSC